MHVSAGKTSAIGVLSGEHLATQGDAFLDSHSISSNPTSAFQSLGLSLSFESVSILFLLKYLSPFFLLISLTVRTNPPFSVSPHSCQGIVLSLVHSGTR